MRFWPFLDRFRTVNVPPVTYQLNLIWMKALSVDVYCFHACEVFGQRLPDGAVDILSDGVDVFLHPKQTFLLEPRGFLPIGTPPSLLDLLWLPVRCLVLVQHRRSNVNVVGRRGWRKEIPRTLPETRDIQKRVDAVLDVDHRVSPQPRARPGVEREQN